MNMYTLTINTNTYDTCLEFDCIDDALNEYNHQVNELCNTDKAIIELGVYSILNGSYTTIRLCDIKSIEW